ncbi:hypothetical protein [Paenibacillus donghaensis]|uniref:Uncharacterized protein n=1 Tax=Paenibacillus donghaensis TaxID=414771 RepID=A0A2Z2KT38_9BACL|nr:hypothetical protein [Paenibacillus donghaensis]ASA22478.1 hypothetical protein B9T62_17825 [Paenibacillus donghaensis]
MEKTLGNTMGQRMEKTIIVDRQLAHSEQLAGDSDWFDTFLMGEPGYVEITLLAYSESHWRLPDKESSLITLEVDGTYNQTLVLFYGEEPFPYTRLLGWLEAGEHQLKLDFSSDSSPLVRRAWLKEVQITVIPRESPLALIYLHTPVLYGRHLQHPFESRYTDTPLLMLYRVENSPAGTVLEYHMLYSHEDAGTPAPLLMSKWGRLTDIEWTYRVTLDQAGEVLKAEYQAPHHETKSFAGRYALGGHPVLQAATDNGNVTDAATSSYRFLLPPAYHWQPDREPRERAMDEHPFTYQMMAWELQRQEPWENPCNPDTMKFTDPRHYLYIQTSSHEAEHGADSRTSIDLRVKRFGEERWYSSCFDDFRVAGHRAAYDGPYNYFATSVKMPEGCTVEQLEEIRAVLLPGGADNVAVKGLKFFYLDEQYRPGAAVETEPTLILTGQEPAAVLWKAAGPYE